RGPGGAPMMQAAEALADEKPFAAADEQFEEIKVMLQSAEVGAMTHSALERLLETEGRELLRRLLQDHLALRGVQEHELGRAGPVVGADGRERPQQRDRERRLMTVFGPVAVPRLGFTAPGTPSLFPLDAELNLPPEFRRKRCR
ncbi:MAG: hypothetical protein QME96_19045, partial [Myxococcota bacterium]|nr:hypothetical protein [Myxococcota bacterium]